MARVNPALARQNQSLPRFIPYPPIEKLGVIGDRRTAAVVAADGTICFWCLPDFSGCPVFGALLDSKNGGYFRLGPAAALLGEQAYLPETAVLVTRWNGPAGCLELTDLMLHPQTDRLREQRDRRTILRRLRCVSGTVRCCAALSARPDFAAPARIAAQMIDLDGSGPGM
ncbi:MAG: trehalase-like domain-containing protein, partial [Bradyrhizobium sp.]